ncbi:RDD family protein [Aequorivita vladivostokensis]|uniref:RDD domain-containing protein n=1 Tax=Aequorivita vladivostokensis TaxID=171194 RepID=A0ABR5DL41_9FLAO|nr:RDD family protein [Aequorivita vladivostokensis]MAO48688.1 hypothetical protein [Aequorivita sp.]KJJ39501.1 hypothetical protein MB09_04540 [Aequorivita vladivostokensis]MBF31480.1 hypothetical protein [Aequorivita sp.]HAV54601.1 hypothetical protein [Aequorivita sp.]HBL78725.1 hypothetical protein [Aequorivita sp.]|tara:strand:+ start:139911 stop:140333 length:423 start_codon:yes stop_codon:yes gene_type:complete
MNVKNKRILALLLDLAIIGFISSLVTSMIKFEWELGTYSLFNHRISFGLSLSVLFYLVYFILCDIFWNSMTIGKEVLKIKVVLQDGAPLELKSRIYRTLLKTISILFWPISGLVFLVNGYTLEDDFSKTKTVEKSYRLPQ